jgi:hypothetical protein
MYQPDDLQDALARFHLKLIEAVQAREVGHEARGLRMAQMAVVEFLQDGMAQEPSPDDWLLLRLFLDPAAAFLEKEQGNQAELFQADAVGKGERALTVAEVGYRAWAARAAEAHRLAGKSSGEADLVVAEATAWVDDNPAWSARLGGALTKNSVRNMRLLLGRDHPVAQFARHIVPDTMETSASLAEQAEWLTAQLASPDGVHVRNLPRVTVRNLSRFRAL